jgi:hypothetical protein
VDSQLARKEVAAPPGIDIRSVCAAEMAARERLPLNASVRRLPPLLLVVRESTSRRRKDRTLADANGLHREQALSELRAVLAKSAWSG